MELLEVKVTKAWGFPYDWVPSGVFDSQTCPCWAPIIYSSSFLPQHWSSWNFLLVGFTFRSCDFLPLPVYLSDFWCIGLPCDRSSLTNLARSVDFPVCSAFHLLLTPYMPGPKLEANQFIFEKSLLTLIKKLTFYEDSRILLPFYFTVYSLFQLKFTF